jgi:hypothetical protein
MTPALQAAVTSSTPETKNMGAAMSGKTVCSVMEAGSFVIIFVIVIDVTRRRIANLFCDSYYSVFVGENHI